MEKNLKSLEIDFSRNYMSIEEENNQKFILDRLKQFASL